MRNLHFFIACEDQLARALSIKLIEYSLPNATYNEPIVTGGCGDLRKKVEPFLKLSSNENLASLILTDLDQILSVSVLKELWLKEYKVPEKFFLHVSVREAESWVLADAEGFSIWADLPKIKIPGVPDNEVNIKERLLTIIRKYSNADFIVDILPSKNSKLAKVGIGYNSRLIEFINNHWGIERAILTSPSLRESVEELKKLKY